MRNKERDFYQQLSDLFLKENQFFNPADILKRSANRYSKRIALRYSNQSYSYEKLYQCVIFWAKQLVQKGIKKGDHIALFLQNSPAFYIAYCAAWQVGAVVIPMNTFLKAAELKNIIHQTNIAVLFIDESLISVWADTNFVSAMIITDQMILKENYPIVSSEAFFFPLHLSYNPDELSVLIFTSGTTGLAKGVMLTGRSIMTNICQVIARLGFTEYEVVAAVLPLFHVFAQAASFWISFLLGATVVLVSKIERSTLFEVLQYKPTIFVGVPALYGFLCMLKNISFSSVRLFVSGGDAMPDKIRMYFALLYGRIIANGYGLSETSPVIALAMTDRLGVTNLVGKPLLDIQYLIKTEAGTVCEPGVIGILFIKSDSVMKGYYQNNKETNAVFINDWFCTGDFAYVTRQGDLVITGRYKDLIVYKGLKIYPQEVENILLTHSQVIRAAVIGRTDESSGQIPVAFVQTKKDYPKLVAELEAVCRLHLASYKIPRIIYCTLDSLPLTATSKVDKKRLS